MSGRFGKGHIPDPPDHKVMSFRFARVSRRTLPEAVDLTPFAPSPLDQSSTSSCVGHATAAAIATSFAKAGKALGFIPSPRNIYQLARCLDRLSPVDKLMDQGSMPNQAIRSLREWGIRPMKAPSPLGYHSDCDLSNVNDEPRLMELEADAEEILIGDYAIDSGGAERIDDVCAALASGFAVTLASFVDTAFENLTAHSAPYNLPDTSDPNGGGHYIFFVGYRTVGGIKQFHLQNSWADWADGGRCWVTEAFVEQTTDLYALNVRKAGS